MRPTPLAGLDALPARGPSSAVRPTPLAGLDVLPARLALRGALLVGRTGGRIGAGEDAIGLRRATHRLGDATREQRADPHADRDPLRDVDVVAGRSSASTIASATCSGSTVAVRPRPFVRPAASSVLTGTGITTLVSTPLPRISPRIASVSPTTACFVAEYVAPPGTPALPAVEAMLTRWPVRRGRKRASASLEPKMTPWRLMSI